MNFLVIEGNIGAGKTTLAEMISKDYNAQLVTESFAGNPFLPKFYANPTDYAFTLEMSFLAERYSQLMNELQNRDLFKDFAVADYYFMKSLIFASVTLSDDEYNLSLLVLPCQTMNITFTVNSSILSMPGCHVPISIYFYTKTLLYCRK